MELPFRDQPPFPVLVAVPALVVLMLTLFAWPAGRLQPRDLPLGAVGFLTTIGPPGAFSIHHYANDVEARHAISNRKIYGAIVAKRGGGQSLLVASAASPVVAQMLERALARTGVTVVDVQPAPAGDPRGAAFASSVLPLVLAGIVLGGILSFTTRRGRPQLVLLLGTAAGAGLAGDVIVQGWLGIVGGAWWRNAGVLALTVLAIAATLVALATIVGVRGLMLGAALMMIVGNPLSAASSAPELLPQPLGAIGQLLPPGAGASALRSTAYFAGAGAAHGLIVIGVWAAAALVMLAAPVLRLHAGRAPAGPARA